MFLDEIGELPAAAQVKLLRAVQEGEVEPVGARKPVRVDVRLISATNRDLIADVKVGRFREDLFYRLHVFPIAVPPLRDRPDDIPALARHFLVRFCAEEGKRIRLITPEAVRVLMAFPWPGNIRQLENALFRAVVLAEGDAIGLAEFPQIAARLCSRNAEELPGQKAASDQTPAIEACIRPTIEDLFPGIVADDPGLPADAPHAAELLPLVDGAGHVRPMEEIEADLIRYAISHYQGQMSEVARRLRIGRSTLYRKLETLGLTDAEAPDRADSSVTPVAAERQAAKIA